MLNHKAGQTIDVVKCDMDCAVEMCGKSGVAEKLFDGNGNVEVGTDSIAAGQTAFTISDTRTLGQSVIQTDINNDGTPASSAGDNTFEYQDTKVIYYATLYNVIDGGITLETRSGTYTVIDNGPSNATINGGGGSDTLQLEATSAHLNNASDAQIVSFAPRASSPSRRSATAWR